MKRSPNVDNIKLGKGELYLFPIVNGVRAKDAFHLGNCDLFESGLEDETLELKSSMNASAATLVKVTRERKVNIRITGHEYSKQNLSRLFMGTETSFDQAGAPVVAEELTDAAVLGGYYQTTQRRISAISLDNTTDTTVPVLGVDYRVVDAEAGIIQFLEGATLIADGDVITIDYTSAAIVALDKVAIGTQNEVEGSLLFLSDNQRGDDVEVRYHRISVTPEGLTGFLSDEYAKWTMNAEALDDAAGQFGGSAGEPFGYVLARA